MEAFFDEIQIKLDEICFRNAYFLKRLHAQIPTIEEVEQYTDNSQKLELVRYVFSTCVLITIFGNAIIEKSKKLKQHSYSKLCLDNISECIIKADAICESEHVKALVMTASGCDHSEVALAIGAANATAMKDDHKKQERCDNLNKVFNGAKERLPVRIYEKITKQMDDVEDPNINEEFAF